MSMAKGILPDTMSSAPRPPLLRAAGSRRGAAGRCAPELAALARQGQDLGGKGHKNPGGQKFIQIDISPTEADSNVAIDAPLVGISALRLRLLAGMGSNWAKPPAEWTSAVAERKNKNVAKMPRPWPKIRRR